MKSLELIEWNEFVRDGIDFVLIVDKIINNRLRKYKYEMID